MGKENRIKILQAIISVLLIMMPTLIFGYFDKTAAMTISLFAGFASAVMINIDKFESFKAGQIEAKMNKAVEIIDEANATIDQLKSVTTPLLNSNLSLLLYNGVFDGMDTRDKEKTLNELLEIMRVINIDSDYTSDIIKRTKNSIANFYFSDIRWVMSREGREKFEKYFPGNARMDFEPYSLKKIDKFFSINPDVFTDEVKDSVEKYKNFIKQYIN